MKKTSVLLLLASMLFTLNTQAQQPSIPKDCGHTGNLAERINDCHYSRTLKIYQDPDSQPTEFRWDLVEVKGRSYYWMDASTGKVWSPTVANYVSGASAKGSCTMHTGLERAWSFPTADEWDLSLRHGYAQVFSWFETPPDAIGWRFVTTDPSCGGDTIVKPRGDYGYFYCYPSGNSAYSAKCISN